MRRTDRQLSEEEAWHILQDGEYGILSTVGADGVPYGVPLNYACEERTLFMHCAAAEGLKIANVRHNAHASFTVVGKTTLLPAQFGTLYESAICRGTVRILEERQEKHRGIQAILHKYSPDFIESGMKFIEASIDRIYILQFTVTSITGKGRKK